MRKAIRKFARIRKNSKALIFGSYQKLVVKNQQLAFLRNYESENVIVLLNLSSSPVELEVPLRGLFTDQVADVLNNDERIRVSDGILCCTIPPRWGRILQV